MEIKSSDLLRPQIQKYFKKNGTKLYQKYLLPFLQLDTSSAEQHKRSVPVLC